ncbi:hypothetical protein CRENBAI_013835 [Crenichthys baileyi]|uniref:Uncharacterized protein n=1 Tax=Crenichthys baileyi TaxID=28760 RepID=A0AAV9SEJ4_9TELE
MCRQFTAGAVRRLDDDEEEAAPMRRDSHRLKDAPPSDVITMHRVLLLHHRHPLKYAYILHHYGEKKRNPPRSGRFVTGINLYQEEMSFILDFCTINDGY